jgi:hypothetical protein
MCNPEIVLMVHTGRHQTCGEWSGRPEPMVVAGDCLRRRRIMAMTDLLLKSSGPVADQYKVLAGDQVVGHIRLGMGISSRRIHYPSWSRWYVRLQFAVAADAPLHVSDDGLAPSFTWTCSTRTV